MYVFDLIKKEEGEVYGEKETNPISSYHVIIGSLNSSMDKKYSEEELIQIDNISEEEIKGADRIFF